MAINSVNKHYVPKLRFKEFKDLPIKNIQMFSLVKLNKYKQILASEIELLKSNKIGDVKLLPSSKEYDWFSDLNIEDYRVNYGNVITLGRARYANIKKWKGYFISSNNIIIENKNTIDFDYLYYLINKNKQKFYIEKTTYPVFSNEIFKEFDCSISTNIHEQIKISKFLKLLDKQISLLENKLKLTEHFFKFYLIKLFKLFEKQSILRFKTFKTKIINKKLSEFCSIQTGKTPSTKNEKFWNGNIKFITPTDIENKYQNKTKRNLTIQGSKKSKLAPKNSILVTCIASIGKNTIATEDSCFNQQINSLFSKNYDNEYIYYLMCRYSKKMISESSKSATQIITKKEFSNLKFYISIDKSEQNKISVFLSLIDDLKERIKNEIILMNKRKKYYLQKLFI